MLLSLRTDGQTTFGSESSSTLVESMISQWAIRYLNQIPVTDTQSFRRCAKLATPPKWTQEAAPLAPFFPTNIQYGSKKILTVSRIGDWHGKMWSDVRYPVGIIDLLRDVLLNSVYLKFASEGPRQQGIVTILTYILMTEDGEALRNLIKAVGEAKVANNLAKSLFDAGWDSKSRPNTDLKIKGSFSPYQELHVNPNAWASRFARVCAIANAQKSVILCQQRIACPPYGEEPATKLLNKVFQLKEPYQWDGFMWPFGKTFPSLIRYIS